MTKLKHDEKQRRLVDEEEQERMTTAAKAAAEKVFDTAELLEIILLNLPMKDLIHAQATSRNWREAIAGSDELQRRLFLKARNLQTAARAKNNGITPWNSEMPSFIGNRRPRIAQVNPAALAGFQSEKYGYFQTSARDLWYIPAGQWSNMGSDTTTPRRSTNYCDDIPNFEVTSLLSIDC